MRRLAGLRAARCRSAQSPILSKGRSFMTDKIRDAFTENVADPARKAGEALRDAGGKMAESSSAIGIKMLDQAEANAREAFAAMRAAAGAKDLSEVMKIQGDFLREQSQRSVSQAREMGEVILQFGRDAVGAVRGEK
ncbi:phasin family protein [Sphingomonas sp. PAMC 26605]|uniref:phasin family protein n=1 Tax=Sphingomonas sp. PAMC 26605 TaxID=1112214 RepID=UPI001E4365E3|nr:phasin family protein [Sphingomonas sp. PAMC 26605]